MPLSEYEKRTLEGIEESLSLDDPHLSTSLVSMRSPRRVGRSRTSQVLTGLGLLVCGLIAALAGVHANDNAGTIVGAVSSLVLISAIVLVTDGFIRDRVSNRGSLSSSTSDPR
jgi:hypothetical protein